ncbi:hypothetical protein YTCETSXE_CDS0034 [Staphylococcus phage MVC_VPHSA2]|uniref:Uncharacterized protein n=1 Tax=Staphylococcus phage MVC_VPHSA1 TaxID=3088876 RepID=A0ABZ0QZ51_9CAUD|nr:hypothetical protein FBHYGVHD_CDS0099 [Staphylococcus phage MVC_VPHSA1]WPF64990.1 hypothetical protein YTCETSXE_CDS0034 [Staphylococcus phage MVC_VPHSA2]
MELTYKGHRQLEEQQRVLINTAQSFGITFEKSYNFGVSVSYHEYKAVANRFKKDELERIAKHIDELILNFKAQEETACSTEEELPSGKQPNKHDITKEIVQLRHTKELDRARFRTVVMKSLEEELEELL